ncbi:testis-expressed sequence 37 protein [Perognathus longimembris pacificus]|uniref:testis-expressed sequence 37 protein n=1 Tax=Perognathus longimembris pacificus TaxID=214514 RepID=UPI002018BFC1|nr:testis-expressed sequence 37 protein [Perognathus longimembris pacificus]
MPYQWRRRRQQKLDEKEDPCAWLKAGVRVDLDIYQSSYMVDYKPYGKQKYSSVSPQEQAKLDRQLRSKEFYKPILHVNPRLQDGFPAFQRPHMTARDLGLPGFFPPQDNMATAGGQCLAGSVCPLEGMALPALTMPRRLGPRMDLRGLLDPTSLPGQQEDKALPLPGSLDPHHWTSKVPLLDPLGPSMPFYQ